MKAEFDRIWLPPAVARELVDQGQGWSAVEPIQGEISAADWIETRHLEPHLVPSLSAAPLNRLDQGEAQAIALAQHHQKPLFVDDRQARKVASEPNVFYFGSLGVIKLAKRKGAIPRAAPLVRQFQDAGIYLSDELVDRFLQDLGET